MTSEISVKRKAALFVDFDNMHMGLQDSYAGAADAFANEPGRWLRWLENGMPGADKYGYDGCCRSILVRRCYLDPRGSSKYRAEFTKDGFSVVDCPPITKAGKNSADIIMIMDILDALDHRTRFDEFIIMSGDSDFTPVLHRLRAHDRRTTVLVPSPVIAAAYRSSCDFLIPEELFVECALGISQISSTVTKPPASNINEILSRIGRLVVDAIHSSGSAIPLTGLPRIYRECQEFARSNDWLGYGSLRVMTDAVVRANTELRYEDNGPMQDKSVSLRDGTEARSTERETQDPLRQKVIEQVRDMVAKSDGPVLLASVAQSLTRQYGNSLADNGWFAFGSFQKFMESDAGEGFQVVPTGPGYLVDPARHAIPEEDPETGRLVGLNEHLVSFILRVHRLTDTPDLSPDQYKKLFEEIAKEIDSRGYGLSQTSKAVRDSFAQEEMTISRAAVTFVLRGIIYSGYRFGGTQTPTSPGDLAQAFYRSVLGLLTRVGVELTGDEKGQLAGWLMGGLRE